ncbi:hypothetical protein [Brevibacterium moorei]|uniref:hypothetical protein n=1 Tax=Brevibacterium moorei TaxID=2968457 RepID=UPI00211B8755|nr:hypothetical protein [Brevibacterium sp. 68QC2CO]MCQ9386810.1 hypothetical protein [Brevibacterium sp. 68QC2CO]
MAEVFSRIEDGYARIAALVEHVDVDTVDTQDVRGLFKAQSVNYQVLKALRSKIEARDGLSTDQFYRQNVVTPGQLARIRSKLEAQRRQVEAEIEMIAKLQGRDGVGES